MIAAVRTFGGSVCPIVAPLGEDIPWHEAQEEVSRRLRATASAGHYELSSRIIARAYDSVTQKFPECREEIRGWSLEHLVEFYLSL